MNLYLKELLAELLVIAIIFSFLYYFSTNEKRAAKTQQQEITTKENKCAELATNNTLETLPIYSKRRDSCIIISNETGKYQLKDIYFFPGGRPK